MREKNRVMKRFIPILLSRVRLLAVIAKGFSPEAILKDKKRILPCAVCLEGEYGVRDGMFVGVPAKLGANGVEEIVQLKLTEEENAALQKSVEGIRKQVALLKF